MLTIGKSVQDYEKLEDERSDFINDRLLKYVDICVGVDERSAQVCLSCMLRQLSFTILHLSFPISSSISNIQSLTHVTDAIDRIRKKADREYFIKTRGTGSLRPVERHGEV